MKRLLVAILLATLAYSAWWYHAAQSLQNSVEDWFADLQAAGWDAGYDHIAVRGFPSRTDLTLTNPRLITPDGSIEWHAGFFQILGLSYKQGHKIVAWPPSQTLVTQDGQTTVTSDGLRASIIHDGPTVLRTNVEATTLNISGADQTVALAGVNAALEKIAASDASYRIALLVDGMATANPTLSGTRAPDSFAALRSEFTADLTAPITLDMPRDGLPNPARIALPRSEITYGALTFRMTGAADFDSQGRATGDVTLRADNWRESLNDARDNGDLPTQITDAVIELLSMLSTLNGARDALDVTLGLQSGTILLGPVPIGTLPPFPMH